MVECKGAEAERPRALTTTYLLERVCIHSYVLRFYKRIL